MSYYQVGDVGLIFGPSGLLKVIGAPVVGPEIAPFPLSTRLVITGHSISDNIAKGQLQSAISAMGGTSAIFSSTGPFASAQVRWVDDHAAPIAVRAAMEAPGAAYDAFLGIEAYGGSYEEGRSSVLTHITWSDAFGYALLWHNLAHSAGCTRSYYGNFWRNGIPEGAPVFDAAWRAAQELEKPYWHQIIDYVNANKAAGSPPMHLVPWLEVFCAVYDGIQSGAVTGIVMGDLFSDQVHISATVGSWVQLATVLAVIYHRHPDTLPASGLSAPIPEVLAAQLRPIIWSTCLGTPRTGLAA